MKLFDLKAGIEPDMPEPEVRATRIANSLNLVLILHGLIFNLYCFWTHENFLAMSTLSCLIALSISHLLMRMNQSLASRIMLILTATVFTFWGTQLFGRESQYHILLLAFGASSIFLFTWEERFILYPVASFPIILLVFSEFYHLDFLQVPLSAEHIHSFRILSTLTTISMITLSFLYFWRQSQTYEDKIQDYILQLKDEHQKQIQFQRMSSLGQMAGGMAHEINNPLAIILGRSAQLKRMVSENPPPIEKMRASIINIDVTVQRISKVVRSLRNFARNTDDDPIEVTSLQGLVSDTLDLCSQRFSSLGIDLVINVPDEFFIKGRPAQIGQVIHHLLTNSLDAVKNLKNPWVKIEARIQGAEIEVLVKDSGPGIPTEIAEKIMEPFFTTKEIGEGSGLGLSISRGIMQTHKGRLEYRTDGGNTCFALYFPEFELLKRERYSA